jgi:integrase
MNFIPTHTTIVHMPNRLVEAQYHLPLSGTRFGSLLINNGAPLIYVCRQMGHSSIQITADIYGHLYQDSYTEHIEALDSMHLSAPHPHPAKQKRP